MNRARTLLELQKYDRARDQALSRLRAVVDELRGNPELELRRKALDDAKSALAAVESRLRAVNLEREGAREHIAREEGKLYGGKVKAPKELQNLQLEVGSLKNRLRELDDVSLELMISRDDALAAHQAAADSLTGLETATAARTSELTAERAKLAKEIRKSESGRDAVAASVAAADLAVYQRIRRAKGGAAVAVLSDAVCGGCGMSLPRTAVELARQPNALERCPGCGRILSP